MSTENEAQLIKQLASLSPIEYDRVRSQEAKNLNIRISSLDEMIKIERNKAKSGNSPNTIAFSEVEPCPEEVDGDKLLFLLVETIRQFVVLSEQQTVAISLWILFTYFIDGVQTAPILNIASPEKRCGKTTLLAILSRLVKKPLPTSNITPAALFRTVEQYQPTLLIDECDTFVNDERSELRGIINSGHTRSSAFVIRTIGDNHEPCEFSTWCAKCLAGIGNLPDTIKDRSIIIQLRRKLKDEATRKIRDFGKSLVLEIQRKCLRFSIDNLERMHRIKPNIPTELNDRAGDNWEPLVAIADLAGGEWPKCARKAAVLLSGLDQESVSLSVELLQDIKEIFNIRRTDRIASADLVNALCVDDEAPWLTYNRGKPITQRQLAKKLKEFSINSGSIRLGEYATPKGYYLKNFEDAFKRYIPDNDPVVTATSATTPQSALGIEFSSFFIRHINELVADKMLMKAAWIEACGTVADKLSCNKGCLPANLPNKVNYLNQRNSYA